MHYRSHGLANSQLVLSGCARSSYRNIVNTMNISNLDCDVFEKSELHARVGNKYGFNLENGRRNEIKR